MDLEQLKKLLAQEPAPLVVDVRSREEYETAHLANTIHVPFDEVLFAQDVLRPYKKVIFICAHGPRAREVCLAYESLGFTQCDYVEGNIEDWKHYDLPVVDSAAESSS